MDIFYETYIPAWVREQQTYEFIELVQGNQTLAQYETEFIFLARYALELVKLEDKKAGKFQRGLREDIRHALAGVRITDYPIVGQRAYVIEQDQNELRSERVLSRGARNNSKKRKTRLLPVWAVRICAEGLSTSF